MYRKKVVGESATNLTGGQCMDVQALTQSKPLQTAGRGDRVARTREAIVASALALAAAGQVAPIVRDIAQMAGVSARTVFQHFADTAELYVAVLGRVLPALVGEAPELAGGFAFEERINYLVSQCADRYEHDRCDVPKLTEAQSQSVNDGRGHSPIALGEVERERQQHP